jgi:hypothetical protein
MAFGIGTPQVGAGSYFAPVGINPATVPPIGVVQPIMPSGVPSIATPGLTPAAAAAPVVAPASTPAAPASTATPAPVGTGRRPIRDAINNIRDRTQPSATGEARPGRDFVSDFAAGVAQPTQGGPMAAFLGGFAGAVGSDRAREAARAAAAVDAEERAYQREQDALSNKRDDAAGRRADRTLTLTEQRDQRAADQAALDSKNERARLEADAERNRLLNAKTAAEIAGLDRAAQALLTPGDLQDINTQSTNFYNARRQALIGNGFMPLNAEQLASLDAEYQQFKADLTEQYLVANGHDPAEAARLGGDAAVAPAAATPPPGPDTATPLPTIPGLTGVGTQEQPYTGASVNPTSIRTLAQQNPGRDIYFVDPATHQLMVVNVP